MSSSRFRDAIDSALSETSSSGAAPLDHWLAPSGESRIEQVRIESISEPDWRPAVDATDPAYRALKSSIRASGILQPLLLRPLPAGGYQVVSGLRRLHAARETGQVTVPAVVRELNDAEAVVGTFEALLRSPLGAAEYTRLRERLSGAGMGDTEVEALLAAVPVAAEAEETAVVSEVAPAALEPLGAAEDQGAPAVADLAAEPAIRETAEELDQVEGVAENPEVATATEAVGEVPAADVEAAAPTEAPAAELAATGAAPADVTAPAAPAVEVPAAELETRAAAEAVPEGEPEGEAKGDEVADEPEATAAAQRAVETAAGPAAPESPATEATPVPAERDAATEAARAAVAADLAAAFGPATPPEPPEPADVAEHRASAPAAAAPASPSPPGVTDDVAAAAPAAGIGLTQPIVPPIKPAPPPAPPFASPTAEPATADIAAAFQPQPDLSAPDAAAAEPAAPAPGAAGSAFPPPPGRLHDDPTSAIAAAFTSSPAPDTTGLSGAAPPVGPSDHPPVAAAGRPSAPVAPRVITIDLPEPVVPEAEAARRGPAVFVDAYVPSVAAPPGPIAPPGDVASASSTSRFRDPRIYATVGTFLGVWAVVFVLVALILGEGGSGLIWGAGVALAGFMMVMLSFALPRRVT